VQSFHQKLVYWHSVIFLHMLKHIYEPVIPVLCQNGWWNGAYFFCIQAALDFYNVNTHTHVCLRALCLGLPGWAGTRKVKPIWILLKQKTESGSGISWAMRKSAPRSREITMPAPHHSLGSDATVRADYALVTTTTTPPLSFLQAGFPSCRPTNSVKALQCTTKKSVSAKLRVFFLEHFPNSSLKQFTMARRPSRVLFT